MKFSHSLQFNAVPEWSSKYIAYSTLKKLIYTLQRDEVNRGRAADAVIANPDAVRVFSAALDAELKKIDEFYQAKEKAIYEELDTLQSDFAAYEAQYEPRKPMRASTSNPSLPHVPADVDSPDAAIRAYEGGADAFSGDEYGRRLSIDSARSAHLSDDDDDVFDPRSFAYDQRISLKKRAVALFTSLSELKSYTELNSTGFTKALKKFDKSLNTKLKPAYTAALGEKSYVFYPETQTELRAKLAQVVGLYAALATGGNADSARTELRVHLREHVVWERNTIWRDMIGMERKTQAAGVSGRTRTQDTATHAYAYYEYPLSHARGWYVRVPKMVLARNALMGYAIALTTAILLRHSPFVDPAQRNCFAILVCASLLWASETIPLFVTSLLVPLMIVVLGVVKDAEGTRMPTPDASRFIFSAMWSSVIMLLLGGFTLAAALSKYHIAKMVSTWLLLKAGTRPSTVLLAIMGVALFASMWVSNVAAPVLCFSIVQPLLRTLPPGSTYSVALILGIALAANIGGMASPIASPQNIIAIGEMYPAPLWGQWFVVALPVCILSLLLIWGFLVLTFRQPRDMRLAAIRTIDDKFTGTQWYISLVTLGTIVLWCLASRLEGVFGEMGVIAIIPLLMFYGPGLLTTADFNNYPWNIVVLAMGGIALGKAVSTSGLLATIAVQILTRVAGFSLFGVMLTFGALVLVVATFVLHTVAALIIVPLVREIGEAMPDPHPRLLVMCTALLCSAAMGLPTSGFPNVTAICMTDEVGKPYLTVKTFITRGVPSSVLAYVVVLYRKVSWSRSGYNLKLKYRFAYSGIQE
ncbi:hypothetical protein BABINDRAFT_164724 [Babjeviella inositovora NRRL Y-12698]|uniref:SPX domain-containing protein n=1 Tax=Babjeviella inositovora NRRL Y-12698 TaxID=984486 RepID=A0A1E3QZ98_9ASCO|nr:uncharacterized protein BABINDRAFT_164724 [Babjeviella inositovora NRRL Y-12698]ODQ83009.1 hypothetical protein BABINDRAFT_164724 [Babjeviella inositovora NRRL Y-12698]